MSAAAKKKKASGEIVVDGHYIRKRTVLMGKAKKVEKTENN